MKKLLFIIWSIIIGTTLLGLLFVSPTKFFIIYKAELIISVMVIFLFELTDI